jgi:hypothetical protein
VACWNTSTTDVDRKSCVIDVSGAINATPLRIRQYPYSVLDIAEYARHRRRVAWRRRPSLGMAALPSGPPVSRFSLIETNQTRTGTPFSKSNVRRKLNQLLASLKLKPAGLHAFRHGRVSMLQANGVSGDLVKLWVGIPTWKPRLIPHTFLKSSPAR